MTETLYSKYHQKRKATLLTVTSFKEELFIVFSEIERKC